MAIVRVQSYAESRMTYRKNKQSRNVQRLVFILVVGRTDVAYTAYRGRLFQLYRWKI